MGALNGSGAGLTAEQESEMRSQETTERLRCFQGWLSTKHPTSLVWVAPRMAVF